MMFVTTVCFLFLLRLLALLLVASNLVPRSHSVTGNVRYFQRQSEIWVRDWYSVLEAIGKVTVLMNAFILAFTSEFIPKLAYT